MLPRFGIKAMQITCNGCDCRIHVPAHSAGKRVKCSRCATIIKVPAPESHDDPEVAGVSANPLAPPPASDPEPFDDFTPQRSPSRRRDDDEDMNLVRIKQRRSDRGVNGLAVT